MTLFAHLSGPPSGLVARRERWELSDGDFIDVDRYGDEAAPTVVLLHGLEGSSRASYVLRLVAAALAEGLSALAMNLRGCSGEENRLPRLYHSGETGDLAEVVARLVAERPARSLAVAGFSLGGNVVAKWLGEQGARLPAAVRAGAVLSAPFDLGCSVLHLDRGGGLTALYRARLLRSLRRKAVEKTKRFADLPFRAAEVRTCRTFAAFDELVTARLHGFAGARDYWDRCSSGPFLGGLRVPLLAIAAEDDPMVPAACLPRPAALENRNLTLEVYPSGGHVAFVAGPPWGWRFFAHGRMASFLARALRR
jgi:uncharacterized protein